MSDEAVHRKFDLEAIEELLNRFDKPRMLDLRSDDEILGYNEFCSISNLQG